MAEKKAINRSARMPIWPKDKDDWPLLRRIWARYRRLAYQLSAQMEVALAAGAFVQSQGEAEVLVPDYADKDGKRPDTAADLLQLLLGAPPRDWLLAQGEPLIHGDMADHLLRTLRSRLRAADPDIPKCKRDYLMLNGTRRPPLLRNLPLPIRMRCNAPFPVAENGHTLVLRAGAGQVVPLSIGSVDASTWSWWQKVLLREVPTSDPATLHLDRKGRLWLRFGYHVPDKEQADPERVLEVAFDEDPAAFVNLVIRRGHRKLHDLQRNRSLSAVGALAIIDRLGVQDKKAEAVSRAVNRKDQPRAGRSEARRRNLIATNRGKVAHNWNHQWTKAIAVTARRWNCGVVKVWGPPEDLYARTWPWADFKLKLEYKCRTQGVAVEYVEAQPA